MTNQEHSSSELVLAADRAKLTAVIDSVITMTPARDSALGRLIHDILSHTHGNCHFGDSKVPVFVHSRGVCSVKSVTMGQRSSKEKDSPLLLLRLPARMLSTVMNFTIIMPPRDPAAIRLMHLNLMPSYGRFQSYGKVVNLRTPQEYKSMLYHIMTGSIYFTEFSYIAGKSHDNLFDYQEVASSFDTDQLLAKYCLHTELQWKVSGVFSLITGFDEYTICRRICKYLSYQDLRKILHAYHDLSPSEAEAHDFDYLLIPSGSKRNPI